jgi:hypothetical protein
MNKWTNEQMNKCTNEQMNHWKKEGMKERSNEAMKKYSNEANKSKIKMWMRDLNWQTGRIEWMGRIEQIEQIE